jgi:hypothetical protein
MLPLLLSLALNDASVLVSGVPHVEQRPDFCGEACAEMGLRRLGIPITQDQIFALSGVDPLKGRGLVTDELARTLRKLGFEPGQVWHRIDPTHADEQIAEQWSALHKDLERGVPSIICGWSSFGAGRSEHMRLVVGYDEASDEVLYEEPGQASDALIRVKRDDFLKLWTFKPSAERWTLIRMALERVGPLPGLPTDTSVADLSQHVQALKEKAPRGATVVREGPFIVVGDEPPPEVRRRATDTVGWTRSLLKKDFFDEDPDGFTDVWIFKDRQSYESNATALFGEKPTTPYGYFLPERHAMVMNIKPGYGTLVHELVHPYVAKNCPSCPAWLNEGLASLFERPIERDGHLVGLPNWRLPGLQVALKAGRVRTFEQLMALSDSAFYADDEGVNYAQARYLCYWLQEHGLLVKLVRGMQRRRADDATGYGVLSSLVDVRGFDARWARDTLALSAR